MKTLIRFVTNKTVILAGILMLALVLRVYHYTANPLWIDEAWTLYVSQHSWIEIPFLDVHPPIHYWLVKIVTGVFGASEAVIRMPSLVFGVVSVGLIYLFTKEYTGSDWAGLVAAGLLAVSRDAVFRAQDARNYTVWICVFMVFAIVYLRAIRTPTDKKLWLVTGLLSGLCMWVHYWSIFPITILGLYTLVRYRAYLTSAAYAAVGFFGLFIPLIPIFLQGISTKASEGWTIFHPWQRILQDTWMELISSSDPILAIIFGVLMVIGLYAMVNNQYYIHHFEVTGVLIVGTAIAFLATAPWFMTLPKYAMYLVPFIYSLVGIGVCSFVAPYATRNRMVAAAGIWLVIVMASMPLAGYYASTNRDGWYDNNAELTIITGGKPVTVLANPGLATQWAYYYSGMSEPFMSLDNLMEITAKNTNGTFVFVPGSEIPPDLPEARAIYEYLAETGVPVEPHHGFDGWYVE